GERKEPSSPPSSGDCAQVLAQLSEMRAKVDSQVAAPAEMRTPTCTERIFAHKECGWKDGDRGGRFKRNKPLIRKINNRLDTHRPSHGRTWCQSKPWKARRIKLLT